MLKGTVGGDGGDFAGSFADVTVKARRWIEKVLRVFINALHFALKPHVDTITTCSISTFRPSLQTLSHYTTLFTVCTLNLHISGIQNTEDGDNLDFFLCHSTLEKITDFAVYETS